MLRIERDAITPTAGYPPELFVDGIRLLDRGWLDFIGQAGESPRARRRRARSSSPRHR
jgi:hypothetical protein